MWQCEEHKFVKEFLKIFEISKKKPSGFTLSNCCIGGVYQKYISQDQRYLSYLSQQSIYP